MDDSTAPFADQLTFEGLLPLEWSAIPERPDLQRCADFNAANERLLHLITALEDHRPEQPYPDDHAGTHSADLQRIEYKLDIMLELVGEIFAAQHSQPQARAVQFNAHGIRWNGSASDVPREGSLVRVSLYPFPALPRCLQMVVEVTRVQDCGHNQSVSGRFSDLSEATVDQLEKFIFRHHRRAVASARHREA